MPAIVELHPGIGSVWARGLTLWDMMRTGEATDWSHAPNSDGPCKAWDITITLPDATDQVYTLVALDLDLANQLPPTYLASAPGFNATLNHAYPDTLPNELDTVTAFSSMLWAWRQQIWSNVAGVTSDIASQDDSGARYGLVSTFFKTNYVKNLVAVVDGTGIVHGDLGDQVYVADPSDFIGQRPGAAAPGGAGGGSVDLTPLVMAVQDISDQDVEYQANQTGPVWSIKARIRAG